MFATPRHIATLIVAIVILCLSEKSSEANDLSDRYLVLNLQHDEASDETFRKIAALAKERSAAAPRIGVGVIVSYFSGSREESLRFLRESLRLAAAHEVAIVVQLDGEQWWQGRPDLWNWWDPNQAGFNPDNVHNVEWTGWGPEHAVKIAWRNWGSQIRVLPPPNLMSPQYRSACHAEMKPLLEEVIRWKQSLQPEQSHLFIGVKVGWESSIGVNAYHYPRGNELLDNEPAEDPVQKVQDAQVPDRGFQPIGFAAVTTAGLASSGELQEAHLTEVVRRHLADLSAVVHKAGLPRRQSFVHCGGWAQGETLYIAALNADSCPGWSFYKFAADPQQDETVMAVLRQSEAPYWAAVEWYPHGAKTANEWSAALEATLSIDRCRYVGVYNWREVKRDEIALAGIRKVMRMAGE